jgi:hypothetical protein
MDKEKVIYSVPVNVKRAVKITKEKNAQAEALAKAAVEPAPLGPIRSWIKYHTTKDEYGFVPVETREAYIIVGICYIIFLPVAICGIVIALT